MIAILILLVVLGIVWLEIFYRTAIMLLIWAPLLCVALAMGQIVQRSHPADPLAPLWAFIAVALTGRFLIGRVRDFLSSRREIEPDT